MEIAPLDLEILVLNDDYEEVVADSINDNGINEFEIAVYPNPTNEFVNIQCSEKILSVEICNIMGDKITDIIVNNTNLEIQMNNFSKGVYIIKVISETKTYLSRVVYQ